jgi:FMN phosphatase YigB (HAD superfamily)
MLTIVWDVDDVLNDLMAAWFSEEWLPVHPECALCYADLRENPPHRVLGIEKREYLASLDSFRLSPKASAMKPNAAIIEWLRRYGGQYRHVALTARPLESAPAAAEWLFRHFGIFFRCFGLVPSRLDASEPVYDRNKADFLQWFRQADFFIDDSEDNVAAVRALGVKCLLFPQPWNGSPHTAGEVLKVLTEQAVMN